MTTAEVKIVLAGIELETQLPVSRDPQPIGAFLPIARAFTEAILQASVRIARENGKEVSCLKGCSACCSQQLIPVALGEAHEIVRVLETMPEPMRSEIGMRFQRGVAQLRDSGVLSNLDMTREKSDEEIEQESSEYRNLQIPCPFLVDDSCSIYQSRPLICREYMVHSDPVFCKNLTGQGVELVPLAAHASRALMHLDDSPGIGSLRWVPMICVLDWVRENPEPPAQPGTVLLGRFLDCLGKEPRH
jgi:Fe-S-cluster containining protein